MPGLDVSVVVPVLNERENVERLLPRTAEVLRGIGCTHELIVVDGGSSDGTAAAATAAGARVIRQSLPGYGGALREGLAAAAGSYVVTLDADLSHDPDFIVKLWRARQHADVVIASRWVKGGVAYMPRHRWILSLILNVFFARGLGLPLGDLSSGFRLYRAAALQELELTGTNFEILEEILVKAYSAGWRVTEIPFTYYPREQGSSHARIFRFGIALLRAFLDLWALRASTLTADYEERAFYSALPPRRWWHRGRHQRVCAWARGAGKTLHLGCGSSVILQSINDAVGLDHMQNKLRYMRRYDVPLVRGTARALPIRDGAFECVIGGDVLDGVQHADPVLAELRRVLRPGGLLILGALDPAALGWRVMRPFYGLIEPGSDRADGGGRTRAELLALCRRWGFRLETSTHVLGAELLVALRKDEAVADAAAPPPSPAELDPPVHAERVR